MVDLELVIAPAGDLLRLVALPVMGWAAWRDIRTRRVPNRTWIPLAVLGLVLLATDAWGAYAAGGYGWRIFALRAGISLGFLVPFAYLFWAFGGFGGADAKAIMALAVLFPTYPEYLLGGPLPDLLGTGSLPVVTTTVGVFAFTVLTNAVLVGAAYPVGVTLRNALGGRVNRVMFVGRPIPVERLPEAYGRLLETPEGYTRRGADLDAIRMYLRWRRADLAELRADPERFRDPDSLPATLGDPTDGAVMADGGEPADGEGDADADSEPVGGGGATGDGDPVGEGVEEGDPVAEDPWGAEAFVAEVGEPYGTSAGDLRDALTVVAEADRVWVSPGLPFMVPLFVGLVVAVFYGDLLFGVLTALGLV